VSAKQPLPESSAKKWNGDKKGARAIIGQRQHVVNLAPQRVTAQ
jgi:hypothetical protein